MENLETKIKEFLRNVHRYSYGDGDGDGHGDGYGYGDDRDIKSVQGKKVYLIDDTPTVIYSVHDGFAKGAILKSDLTLNSCYIAKIEGHFAHGATVRDAFRDAQEKAFDDMSEEERIDAFVEAHELNQTYPTMEFFNWHHKLTGSCEMGRREFAREHEIDLDGTMTTREFLELKKNDYGGETIKMTMERYAEMEKGGKSQ